MGKLSALLSAAAAAALLFNAGAEAKIVDLSEQGSNVWGSPRWAQNAKITVDGTTKRVGAGVFRLNDEIKDILAFCIEPYTTLDLSQSFDTEDHSGDWMASFAEIDKLFTSSFHLVENKATAAGFQLALWEVIVEDTPDYDLKAGDFTVKASKQAVAAANMFLSSLDNAGTGGYRYTTYANAGQDLISVEAVPVPAAAILFGPAIAAVAMRKRRKA